MINMLIDVIAQVLPGLHSFTQTKWLVYQDATITQLYSIIIQTFIYTILISGAAAFDLYRKEL